ncbi:MAG: methylated-DNA--[protein]-cysteine S-methyltransferase [Candidatus Saccharicenans sp.]|nr:methylated-DNA--[protein]-cysteine S-methyltransferase [Candidatus Saccharicenans sp.]
MEIYYQSPIGLIKLTGGLPGLTTCSFVQLKNKSNLSPTTIKTSLDSAPASLKQAWVQLDEYFKGTRQKFSVKLDLVGTEFQKKVWAELQKIPYGQTKSYRDIAEACGKPKAFRAVGQANHQNPVVIFIPCHRVIGTDGGLTGYGAGLWRKRWLLAHEKER